MLSISHSFPKRTTAIPKKAIPSRLIFLLQALLPVLLFIYACDDKTIHSDNSVIKTNNITLNENNKEDIKITASIIASGDDKIEKYGFIYDTKPGINKSTNIYLEADRVSNASFSKTLGSAFEPGQKHYFRAFIKTENFTLYGNEISYTFDGNKTPQIHQQEPQSAFLGDTLKIIGKYFSANPNQNLVTLGTVAAKTIKTDQDTLFVIVPNNLNKRYNTLRISVFGQLSDISHTFTLKQPRIDKISQTDAQYPDTVEITGDYFTENGMALYWGNLPIVNSTIKRNSIKFRPPFLGFDKEITQTLYLKQFEETIPVLDEFRINKQEFLGFSVDSTYVGDYISAYFNNVNRNFLSLANLYINSTKAYYPDILENKIVFHVEKGLNSPHFSITLNPDGKYFNLGTIKHASPEIINIEQTVILGHHALKIKVAGTYFGNESWIEWVSPKNEIKKTNIQGFSLPDSHTFEMFTAFPDNPPKEEYKIRIVSTGRFSEYKTVLFEK